MTHPALPRLLRDRSSPHAGKVGWVELFFDLVFVFAVTQLSHTLLHHLNWKGAAEVGILGLAIWVAWMWTTWATNWLDARNGAVRLMFFALMAAGLVLAAALPEAFGERGLIFGCAFALLQNGRNLFTVIALRDGAPNERRNFLRIQVWLIVSGILWVAGGLSHGEARMAIWALALAVEFSGPWWRFWVPGMGRSATADWAVDPAHMAERCGLFIILALGESVIITGATFAKLAWDAPHIAAFAAAFVVITAMWWVYFVTTAEEASERFEAEDSPGAQARAAYTYAHIPIIAGIILTAVGDDLALAHPGGHADLSAVAVLAGGPALFLVGSALFRACINRTLPISHGAGLLVILAGNVALQGGSPLALLSVSAASLALVGAWETLRLRSARRDAAPSHA